MANGEMIMEMLLMPFLLCAARIASGLRTTMVESDMAARCSMSFGLPQMMHRNLTIFAATENGGKNDD